LGGVAVNALNKPPVPIQSDKNAPKVERARPKERVEAAADTADLEARIAELEDRIAALYSQQRSKQALEKYAAALAAEGEGSGKDKAKSAADVAAAEDPAFELAVRSVMDRVDWEKEEEKKAVRDQRRNERTQRQTALLAERLRLTPEQVSEVAVALTTQTDRFRQMREEDAEGQQPMTRSERRTRMEEVRRQTDEHLRKVLSEEQLAQYHAIGEEEGIGPGRPDRARRQPEQAATAQAAPAQAR
jgi:hypothetical protein